MKGTEKGLELLWLLLAEDATLGWRGKESGLHNRSVCAGRGGPHNGINPFPPFPALFIFLEPAILFPLLACLSHGASLLNPLPYPQLRGLSLHISSPPQGKGLISGLLSWEAGSGFWIIYLISKYLFPLPTSSSSPVLGSLLY